MHLSVTLSCRLDRTSHACSGCEHIPAAVTRQCTAAPTRSVSCQKGLHTPICLPDSCSTRLHTVVIQVNKALRHNSQLHTHHTFSVRSAQAKHQAVDWALAAQQQAAHALFEQLQNQLSIVNSQGSSLAECVSSGITGHELCSQITAEQERQNIPAVEDPSIHFHSQDSRQKALSSAQACTSPAAGVSSWLARRSKARSALSEAITISSC